MGVGGLTVSGRTSPIADLQVGRRMSRRDPFQPFFFRRRNLQPTLVRKQAAARLDGGRSERHGDDPTENGPKGSLMKLNICDSIRVRFIERCSGDLHKLREIRDRSTGLPDATVDESFVRTVHGLAGAGGTFGFPEVSRHACALETLLIDNSSTQSDRDYALDVLIATLENLTNT
jgi:hypothetical protein